MSRDYWQAIVAKLKVPETRNWAAHVLASGRNDSDNANLQAAINATSVNEVLKAVIEAYRDRSAHTYCDNIITSFGQRAIPHLVGHVDSNNSNIRLGVLSVLADIDKPEAIEQARKMNDTEAVSAIQNLIEFLLQAGD